MNNNHVELKGKISKDPVVRYTSSNLCWAAWTLNVPTDNGKGRSYISCKAFGEIAEELEKVAKKDMYIELTGHIQTGSYEGRNGKVYTTDVVAEHIDFSKGVAPDKTDVSATIPTGFAELDSDIPF